MRRAIGLLALALTIAVPAQAFDGYEHRSVSNAAVFVAARYAERTADPAFLARARELAGRRPDSFGDLTVAVDWFQDVTKVTRAEAFDAVGERQRFYMAWLKGLSLHRNTLHFQRQALCAYLTLHRRAMALAAARDTWDDALFTEAVALHFLQDFFSAGHFITPRKHSHDAVAGSLHDHFGSSGLLMKVELSNDGRLREPWRTLAADAIAEVAEFPSPEVRFVAADLQTLDAVRELRIGGDTCLNEVPGQRELVLLMSAKSIAEVMEASRPSAPRGDRIDACFSQRWAQPDSSNSSIESTDPKKRGLPQGAFRLTGSKSAPPGDVRPAGGASLHQHRDADRWIRSEKHRRCL